MEETVEEEDDEEEWKRAYIDIDIPLWLPKGENPINLPENCLVKNYKTANECD